MVHFNFLWETQQLIQTPPIPIKEFGFILLCGADPCLYQGTALELVQMEGRLRVYYQEYVLVLLGCSFPLKITLHSLKECATVKKGGWYLLIAVAAHLFSLCL